MLTVSIFGIYLLVNHTTYFSNPIRKKMLSSTTIAIVEHPILDAVLFMKNLLQKHYKTMAYP